MRYGNLFSKEPRFSMISYKRFFRSGIHKHCLTPYRSRCLFKNCNRTFFVESL